MIHCTFMLCHNQSGVSETTESGVSDNAVAGIGMIVLLVIVAAAVAIFISSGRKTAPYEYLQKESFETYNV